MKRKAKQIIVSEKRTKLDVPTDFFDDRRNIMDELQKFQEEIAQLEPTQDDEIFDLIHEEQALDEETITQEMKKRVQNLRSKVIPVRLIQQTPILEETDDSFEEDADAWKNR